MSYFYKTHLTLEEDLKKRKKKKEKKKRKWDHLTGETENI